MNLKEEFMRIYEGAVNSGVDGVFIAKFLDRVSLTYTEHQMKEFLSTSLYEALMSDGEEDPGL